jgi:arginine decarboxylase
MIDEIINQIKIACDEAEVDAKHFTEFGSFTVGERSAIYQILYQNNKMIEKWNMIDFFHNYFTRHGPSTNAL